MKKARQVSDLAGLLAEAARRDPRLWTILRFRALGTAW
jgi:hypothetical protein